MLVPTEFTSAMREAPTPVSIVTTGSEHGSYGAPVDAVCLLSASAPAVFICLNRKGKILEMIGEHGVYCVTYAAEEHRDLALAFSGVPEHQAKRKFVSHQVFTLSRSMERRFATLRESLMIVERFLM